MSYITTGSSNSVTNGGPLNLDIQISRTSLKEILLMGFFEIDNLNSIIANEDLASTSCVLYGKTKDPQSSEEELNSTIPVRICELDAVSGSPGKFSYRFSRSFSSEFVFLNLKITASKATVKTVSEILKITFTDANNKDQSGVPLSNSIEFEVQNVKGKPEITSFKVNNLVFKDKDKVTFTWRIKGADYSYELRNGLKLLKSGEAKDDQGKFEFKASIGDHQYTLEVKQGDVVVTKNIQIRVLNEPKFSSVVAQNSLTVSNFCVDQDSEYLFSLLLSKEDKSSDIAGVGYTNNGFSGLWNVLTLSAADKVLIRGFITSPMVHLRNGNGVYGCLYFIGGSQVKTTQSQNTVAIVDLDKENHKVTLIENLPWSPRMGHSCTVFQHGGVEKIWLLGGIDEYGVSLNDIWVSGDGKNWDNIDETTAVNPNSPKEMPWNARCLAGITVELDNNGRKKALWFGGGFSEIGGAETSDIWKLENKKWTILKNTKSTFEIKDSPYLSSGIAFVGKIEIDSSGCYLIGGYISDAINNPKDRFFNSVTILNNGKYGTVDLDITYGSPIGLTTTREAKIITTFFRGCMWYIVMTDQGDEGVTFSDIGYWIPAVTSNTLILS